MITKFDLAKICNDEKNVNNYKVINNLCYYLNKPFGIIKEDVENDYKKIIFKPL
jgi:hypothetical protein